MPEVSVILPVCNVAEYLRQCMNSIVGQTLREIEIICVDDGSTDASGAILDEYAARDLRVRVIRQANAGAGAARNAGLAAATGEYVAFVDPDDWCRTDMLERLLAEARRLDCDMVLSAVRRVVVGAGHAYDTFLAPAILRLGRPFAPEQAGRLLFVGGRAEPWAKLYRRKFVSDQRLTFQTLPRVNDLCFSFVALAKARRISVVNEACYNYRIGRPGSLQETIRASARPLCWLEAFRAARARLVADGDADRFADALATALLSMGVRAMTKLGVAGDIEAFWRELRREVADLFSGAHPDMKTLPERERGVLDLLNRADSALSFMTALDRELQLETSRLRAWRRQVLRERAQPLAVRVWRAIRERLVGPSKRD